MLCRRSIRGISREIGSESLKVSQDCGDGSWLGLPWALAEHLTSHSRRARRSRQEASQQGVGLFTQHGGVASVEGFESRESESQHLSLAGAIGTRSGFSSGTLGLAQQGALQPVDSFRVPESIGEAVTASLVPQSGVSRDVEAGTLFFSTGASSIGAGSAGAGTSGLASVEETP